MAYWEIDVRVAGLDVFANKLVIRRKEKRNGKRVYRKTTLRLDKNTLVTSERNKLLSIDDIKVNDRVTVDFIKTQETGLLVKGITLLYKNHERG